MENINCPVPDNLKVIEKKQAVFGAWIKVEEVTKDIRDGSFSRSQLKIKKGELWSGLQKAIRAQNYEFAKQVVVLYVLLCRDETDGKVTYDKPGMSWLFNRLPVIAKEDCATVWGCFIKANQLRKRYFDGGSTIHLNDILDVVKYLCTHGTSRLPSHMRAKHGTRKMNGKDPVKSVVYELGKYKGNIDKERDITAIVGSFTNKDVKSFYETMETYSRTSLPRFQGMAVRELIAFCKNKFGNSVNATKKGKTVRSSDHDMVLREIVRMCFACPEDTQTEKSREHKRKSEHQGPESKRIKVEHSKARDDGTIANLESMETEQRIEEGGEKQEKSASFKTCSTTSPQWTTPFPDQVVDIHVDSAKKRTKEGLRYFATVAAATKNWKPSSRSPEIVKYELECTEVYMKKKGASAEDIEAMLRYMQGEGQAPTMLNPHKASAKRKAPASPASRNTMTTKSIYTEQQSDKSKTMDKIEQKENDGKDKREKKDEGGSTNQEKKHTCTTLGGYSLKPYIMERKGQEIKRFSCSSYQGTKAPTVRTADGLFVKLFRSQEAAEFAHWSYQVLQQESMKTPGPVCRLETLTITEAELDSISDGSQKQKETWKRNYSGQTHALVTSAVGDSHRTFRKICDDDVAANTGDKDQNKCKVDMEELVKVLLIRRAVLQSSDLCTNNLRVYDGHVYSIDHNRKQGGQQVEFIANRFSGAMQKAIRKEVKKNKDTYEKYLTHLRTKYSDYVDKQFKIEYENLRL
eukprot:m.324979 g.324979  ORF g.324979 m.324979 type:complete len:746 (+) comp16545_c0_seq35:235-2472(+)